MLCLVACDQVTSKYDTYEEASRNQLFEKGWIPLDLINSEMSEIFLRTNPDLNTFIFSFKTDANIIDNYNEGQIISIDEVRRINIPKWWKDEVEGMVVRIYEPSEEVKLCLVYNYKTGKLYGWGKHTHEW